MRLDPSFLPARVALSFQLALRLLVGRHGLLLRPTARVAAIAAALGALAMSLAMALMTGYRSALEGKLLEGGAAILVFPWPPTVDESGQAAFEETLRETAGVVAARRTGFIPGVARGPRGEQEVTVRLGPPSRGPMVHAVQAVPPRESPKVPLAVLGEELARALGVVAGDRLPLVTLAVEAGRSGFRFSTIEVAGLFATGFSEFDRSWLVLVPGTFGRGWEEAAAPVFEADVERPTEAHVVAEELRQRLGASALVTDWTQLNQELFAALRLQQRVLFLLLGLIMLVASFAVGATVAVLARERRRDLALLQALGLEPGFLRWTLVLFSFGLAGFGAAVGLVLAVVIASLATRFEWLAFGPEIASIYFLRFVPLRLDLASAGAILALALGTTALACAGPISRLGRTEPAVALRGD